MTQACRQEAVCFQMKQTSLTDSNFVELQTLRSFGRSTSLIPRASSHCCLHAHAYTVGSTAFVYTDKA